MQLHESTQAGSLLQRHFPGSTRFWRGNQHGAVEPVECSLKILRPGWRILGLGKFEEMQKTGLVQLPAIRLDKCVENFLPEGL
jgi:hypothetical protein